MKAKMAAKEKYISEYRVIVTSLARSILLEVAMWTPGGREERERERSVRVNEGNV